MVVYCPNLPTLLSVNGEDYVEYPKGTDIIVTPVTLQYQFLYGYSAYNANTGRDDCSKDVSFEAIQGVSINGGLGYGFVTGMGNAIGISALIEFLGGDQWFIDTLKPNVSVGYRFNNNWTQCGKRVSDVTLILEGVLASNTSLRGISINTKIINAYRLNIATP
jgi:hypothetical protein